MEVVAGVAEVVVEVVPEGANKALDFNPVTADDTLLLEPDDALKGEEDLAVAVAVVFDPPNKPRLPKPEESTFCVFGLALPVLEVSVSFKGVSKLSLNGAAGLLVSSLRELSCGGVDGAAIGETAAVLDSVDFGAPNPNAAGA
eukprot:CAMPEP_0182425356 /NCGR_PEP_ID=MMETSP1167-20130531/11765_1 /TAXON_ID=2988 /ORGANISM="Mallomonas Sp, Strain CCMP3275" /LENGTH=142 /DNA_ID=CAMNT_0024605997 /DNA_START=417 /DNA_END=845 /DNA_ORIENTATION=+